MPAAKTTNAGAELKVGKTLLLASKAASRKWAQNRWEDAKKAQPQENLRCTSLTTHKTNKPNNLIDSRPGFLFKGNWRSRASLVLCLVDLPYGFVQCAASNAIPDLRG
jgi:hypothetical protein